MCLSVFESYWCKNNVWIHYTFTVLFSKFKFTLFYCTIYVFTILLAQSQCRQVASQLLVCNLLCPLLQLQILCQLFIRRFVLDWRECNAFLSSFVSFFTLGILMVWFSISSFTKTKKASKKGSFMLGSKEFWGIREIVSSKFIWVLFPLSSGLWKYVLSLILLKITSQVIQNCIHIWFPWGRAELESFFKNSSF